MRRYGIWVYSNLDFNFGKFIKSVISYFSSLQESREIWAMISEDMLFQNGDSLLIVICDISILLEWNSILIVLLSIYILKKM